MKAEIISIGTELLLGEITDTNASYLAAQLPLLGIDLYWISQVGDNQGRLMELLERAWSRSDLIIVTGGLGPTEDDITRNTIAAMLGEDLIIDPALLNHLESLFARRNWKMPRNNIKQAMIIASSKPISNPVGTAPGWWVEKDTRTILALPGPPSEMQRMWKMEVAPVLAQKSQCVIVSRTFKTMGLSEGGVDEMVSPLLSSNNPTLAVYAKKDGIHLRLTAKAVNQLEAERIISLAEAQLRSILGDNIWGVDDESIEVAIGLILARQGLTLSTMESCTGGLLASTLTDIPGSSVYFKGGLVSYANEVKTDFGVGAEIIAAHGVISPEVADAMAEAARSRFGTDIGIGITGIAGPDEVEGKPVGTVHIAIHLRNVKKVFSFTLPPRRLEVKQRAVFIALVELRRILLAS